tara:strand:+ start:1581 stop:1802 length:222 start_codon:yes stop_codon:yes gene_type:complete
VTERLPRLGHWSIDGRIESSANQWLYGYANGICVSHHWIYALIWDERKTAATYGSDSGYHPAALSALVGQARD